MCAELETNALVLDIANELPGTGVVVDVLLLLVGFLWSQWQRVYELVQVIASEHFAAKWPVSKLSHTRHDHFPVAEVI